jgi:hypothetical protein
LTLLVIEATGGLQLRAVPAKHSTMGLSLDAGSTGDGKVEITLPDGTGIRIGRDVSLVTLWRVMSVLRG